MASTGAKKGEACVPDCGFVDDEVTLPGLLFIWRVFLIKTRIVSVPSAEALSRRSKSPTDPAGESIIRCPIGKSDQGRGIQPECVVGFIIDSESKVARVR